MADDKIIIEVSMTALQIEQTRIKLAEEFPEAQTMTEEELIKLAWRYACRQAGAPAMATIDVTVSLTHEGANDE